MEKKSAVLAVQGLTHSLREKLRLLFHDSFDGEQESQVEAHLEGSISKVCLVCVGESIAGALFFQERRVTIFSSEKKLLSVGPLCTHPLYRGKGVATKLIQTLKDFSICNNFDFIILSGIPEFYSRYDFYPAWEKSKITVAAKNFLSRPENLNISLSPDIQEETNITSYGEHFCIHRDDIHWKWLQSQCRSSYYAPNLTFVETRHSSLEYLTHSISNNVLTIREMILDPQTSCIDVLCQVLQEIETPIVDIEIFTEHRSQIYTEIIQFAPIVFSSFPHPNARGLMNVVNPDKLVDDLLTNPMISRTEYEYILRIKQTLTGKNRLARHRENDYFLPGLLTGYWPIKNLQINNQDNLPNLNHKIILQGDSM